jgi:hypothetical protein
MGGPILKKGKQFPCEPEETDMIDDQLDIPAATMNAADDPDLQAYNVAFGELGLRWRWDLETFRELQRIADERNRIGAYVENQQPHLLKAYDKSFLCNLIYTTKERCHREMHHLAA